MIAALIVIAQVAATPAPAGDEATPVPAATAAPAPAPGRTDEASAAGESPRSPASGRSAGEGAPRTDGASSGPAPAALHGTTVTAGLGGGYRRIFAVNELGGEVFAGLGRRDDRRWGFLMVHLEKGYTEHGLSVWGGRAGAAMEWETGPVRLGGEARLGFLTIGRVTNDSWMSGASLGAEVTLGMDLVTLSESDAVYAQAGFAVDYYEPFVFGPSLRLGYRWDEHPGP